MSDFAEMENFLIFENSTTHLFKNQIKYMSWFETTLLSRVVSVETACVNEP